MALTSAEKKQLLLERAIAPSILAADFAQLRTEVEAVLNAGARVIHVDVMDGHFVPPITFGPLVVSALRETVAEANAVLDVHLMIERPERQIDAFAEAGADVITIHAEATPHVNYALRQVRAAGCLAGLALCPATPLTVAEEAVAEFDLLLCMSVNPGWGGQSFIPGSLDRLARMRQLLSDDQALEVDGGVDPDTASQCVESGANLLVAGSAVFGSVDPATAFTELQDLAA